MRKFLIKSMLIVLAACAVLALLNKRYKKVMKNRYDDQINFQFIGDIYKDIAISNVGSSHAAYGISYDNLTTEGYSCFNFALPSQTYDYDLAILHEYGDNLAKGGIMFIPVSYFSFNNEYTNSAEKKDMETRYYYLLSPQNIPNYSLYTDIVTHRLPVLSSGDEFWKIFPNLSIKADAEEDQTAEPDSAVFAQKALDRYNRHFASKDQYIMPERVQNLKDIISFDKEHEITPVLITTPYTSYYYDLASQHQTEFMTEFNKTIADICSDTGVEYYDYSHDPRICSDLHYFADGDHLNHEGALYFTNIMADDIPAFKEVLKTAAKTPAQSN